MTPQTQWLGGRHPCSAPPKHTPTLLHRRFILDLLERKPGLSVPEMQVELGLPNINTLYSALDRLHKGKFLKPVWYTEERGVLHTKQNRGIKRWYLSNHNTSNQK